MTDAPLDAELQHFQRSAARHIEAFTHPTPYRKPLQPSAPTQGLTVRLGVRERRLAPDRLFVYQSDSLSRLQARFEAERAAIAAGYPIIGYVVDYQMRD